LIELSWLGDSSTTSDREFELPAGAVVAVTG